MTEEHTVPGGGSRPPGSIPSRDGGDRPWLSDSAEVADEARIRTWIQAADTRYAEALGGLDQHDGPAEAARLAPGISVVLPVWQGGAHLTRSLHSLAGQTLGRDLFEVVVVQAGPLAGVRDVVDAVRREHPAVVLRVVQLDRPGRMRALDAGVAAAGRRYTTFLDEGDHVSPRFLEVLLAHAGPRRVPAVPVVGGNQADWTTATGAKAVATDLIRTVPYESDLGAGADVVFWATVLVRGRAEIAPCPAGAGATYHRAAGPESGRRSGDPFRSEDTFRSEVDGPLDVVSRLERLVAEADSATVPLLVDLIRAQATRVGNHLRRNPMHHGRAVDALDRRPISRFPYDQMNRTLGRELVIAYAFPPYVDTSAIVTAKRIRARGEVVDVVSNALGRIRAADDSLRRISGPFVDREAALDTPPYFSSWRPMEAFAVDGLKVIHRWEADKGPYRGLFSRAHFAASHLLAAAYKLSRPTVTWRAEFSDPLSRDVLGRERGAPIEASPLLDDLRRGLSGLGLPVPRSQNCLVWCEELAYLLADELIFMNEGQLTHMLGYCGTPEVAAIARPKTVISPHPTLPSSFYSMVDCDHPLDDGVVNLAYFGNFYPTRGPDDVLVALASAEPRLRARVRFHVFTTRPDVVARRATELGVAASVRTRPYVGYLEFLNLTTRFDCLIVNDAATGGSHARNPFLPSKWSDYRGSGRPVWGLVEAGSALSGQPLDFASPTGDIEAAVRVIAEIMGEKLAGPVAVRGPAVAAAAATGTWNDALPEDRHRTAT